MRRTGFARKVYVPAPVVPLTPVIGCRGVLTRSPATAVVVPKAEPVRSEPYRRAVASLPCWLCCACGYTQAAHGDQGKGMGIKACDLSCWPACGPHDLDPGCHWIVGTSGKYSREERRALETRAAEETRALLIRMSAHDLKLRRVLVDVGLVA